MFDPCAAVACAADIVNRFVDGITRPFASIDGVAVPDLASHVVRVDKGAPFVFKVDAGPIGPDGYGGILDAVEGGIWLMLEPLSSGFHVVTFGATVPVIDPATGEVLHGSIDLDARLQLTAIPEPPSALLLCLGVLALAFGRRFKKSRADATSMP